MKGSYVRLLFITLLISAGCSSLAQGRFKKIVDAAYDSSLEGNYTAAIRLLYEAAALKGVDTGYNASINLYFGNNYEALNRMDSSIFYYGESLKHFEQKKDYASLSFIYNRLGSAEINFTRRYDKAIDYFRRETNYALLNGDSSTLFDAYNNLGIAFKLLNRYDSALMYFSKVVSSTSPHNNAAHRALLFMADTYSLSGRYGQALPYYNRAIRQLLPLRDSTYLFIAYLNKGDCLMKQARYGESMTCFTNAQRFLTPAIINNDRKELYHNLAEVLHQTGKDSRAFYYKNLEAALKDSINTANIQQAAAEAEAKFEVRRNQDSLLISRQKLALSVNQSRVNQRNFLIVLLLALAISLLALLALRNARIRKRANRKLALEKQKVESLAGELEEANQTKTKLFSIISHDLRSPISSLYALLKLQEIKATGLPGSNGISEQATHLLDTLEDLLTWSKSQMDRFTLQPVRVHVNPLYEELIKLYRDIAEARQITISNQAAAEANVVTDENLLKAILRNLLSNAIHHARPGTTILLDAREMEKGITATVVNEADEDSFRQFENKLQDSSLDSNRHGLGIFLTKELTAKLQATTDLAYLEGRIHFKLYIPRLTR